MAVSETYDIAVLGVGGMGSGALLQLARRGVKVCGIEQYGIAHRRGGSHGDTRIIRKVYPEQPAYVPLINRAYELWDQIAATAGIHLFDRCGFLAAGPAGGDYLDNIRRCCESHNLPHHFWDTGILRRHFPQFRLPDDFSAIFDPQGGCLRVEAAVRVQATLARRNGAVIYTHESVFQWRADETGIVLKTAQREIRAGKLIVAGGAWIADLLKDRGLPLRIWRRVTFWHRAARLQRYIPDHFPAFVVDYRSGGFYGCPAIDVKGVKLGEHSIAQEISRPEDMNGPVTAAERGYVETAARHIFPDLEPVAHHHAFCLYTLTPDRHFIVDVHPGHPNVIIAGGFSGHGFKFSPVIGEIVADLALEGDTEWDIDFLRLGRFGPSGSRN